MNPVGEFKYKIVDEIKQTEQFKVLSSEVNKHKYGTCKHKFALFELLSYFSDELCECEEEFRNIEKSVEKYVGNFVDVQDINL